MQSGFLRLVLLCVTLYHSSALAETVFVIDRLLVGVHKEKALDSDIIKVFPTGTKLEVLERSDELARIKGPGEIIGWVDASYLSSQQPALLVVKQLQAELESLKNNPASANAQTAEENERLRQQAASERLKAAALQTELNRLKNQQTTQGYDSAEELAQLKQVNAELIESLKKQQGFSLARYSAIGKHLLEDQQNYFYLAAIILTLLLAFLCGLQLMDWLQRRRHGGFRV